MIYDDSNPQLKLAYNFIHYTNQNLFLTGKAGTGKTTFLKRLKETSPKRMVVVAPTGVAAINAGGVTIHSFFQLPFGPQIPQYNSNNSTGPISTTSNKSQLYFRFSKNKINLIRSLDLLVIDEISMVRADLLDAIDAVLRRFKNRYLPFGGIQLLMIGDLQQLAPVVKDDDWAILSKYYDTCYFFSSKALQRAHFTGIELQHIYRQNEQVFIDLLNKVRDNDMDTEDYLLLNNRYRPNITNQVLEGYITLTTHNYQSKQINEAHLRKLTSPLQTFRCNIEGDFPVMLYPTDEVLNIKTDAQVMFLKNDPSADKRYYNGKIGKVVNILDEEIEVLCPDDTETIKVSHACWENTRYKLNEDTGEIEEEIIGRFYQFPLKLAWAITIHKSQGLTFEKAIIDARQSFAHGQVYVALSRCKSLEGLILSTPLHQESVINDNTVTGFIHEVEQNQPGEEDLNKHRKNYEWQLMIELIDFSPVNRIINYILKYWEENESVLMGDLQTKLQECLQVLKQEIEAVAIKFKNQMQRLAAQPLYAEENPQLQERLQKAADYFSQRFVEITNPLNENAGFQTDNSSIRKKLNESLNNLETEIEIKKSCLQSVSTGFTVTGYLKARALAAIEKPTLKKHSTTARIKVSNADFYEKLIKWRHNKSLETGLQEPKIIQQKVLVVLAEKLPSTAIELKSIKGMGGKKMELFGQDLLSLILNYRKEKGMEIPENAQQEIEFAGLDTKTISLVLFKQGMSVQEIAKKRDYAASTIETHLAHFVGEGSLDIYELIDKKKYEIIARCINEKEETATLSDLKNKLGDKYSFGEIRLVMADINKAAV
ncbi:MAG TPA: helix-turn-helix domain-containing protein [Mariniphaga sp.]|nr:helix-turn-helix domain-containing protein [Mariniphaga sp.]